MAQLINDGKPICRWCKEPLAKKDLASGTRPRELHPGHVKLRKNGMASGRWTRQMDEALTIGEVELLQRRPSSRGGVLGPDALVLQGVLADFLTAEGEPAPELVAALVGASARLLKSMRGGAGEAAAS